MDDKYLSMYNFSVAFWWVVEIKSMHFEGLVHREANHVMLDL
jgi:hypothetical protein